MFVSFYWASIGQPNLVRFGNAAGTSFIFTANGCDLAPACGNPLDRYITFLIADRCGAQALDNIESFDRVMGRRRFALLDREVLNEARRIVKASANSAGQSRRLD